MRGTTLRETMITDQHARTRIGVVARSFALEVSERRDEDDVGGFVLSLQACFYSAFALG